MANAIQALENQLKQFPTFLIEIGIVSTGSKRKKEKVRYGITNAELLYIHEHGTFTNNRIPRRPVLEMTINWANQSVVKQTLNDCVDIYLKTSDSHQVKNRLEQLCIEMENYAKDIIYSNDGRLTPNAPKTAEAKRKKAIKNARTAVQRQEAMASDGNHPLFDTGQMARSITCRVIEIK